MIPPPITPTRWTTWAEGEASLARYALEDPDIEPGSPEEVKAALRVGTTLVAIELGIRHIKRWEGPVGEDNQPAPVLAENVALLMNEKLPIADRTEAYSTFGGLFLVEMDRLSLLEPGAKNVSAASPGTDGAEAGNSASSAGSPGISAPPAGA